MEAHIYNNLVYLCDIFATTSLYVTPSRQTANQNLYLGRHVVVNKSRCPGFFPEFLAAVAAAAGAPSKARNFWEGALSYKMGCSRSYEASINGRK